MNLGSYNYFGFGGVNEYCILVVEKFLSEYLVTSGSFAAEFGRDKNLREVEDFVVRFVGKESVCVVGMGFVMNSMVILVFCLKGDLIIFDVLNYVLIVEGARLSGVKIRSFKY